MFQIKGDLDIDKCWTCLGSIEVIFRRLDSEAGRSGRFFYFSLHRYGSSIKHVFLAISNYVRIVIVFQNRRMPREEIYYSDKYTDDTFEYRHVIVPKKIAR